MDTLLVVIKASCCVAVILDTERLAHVGGDEPRFSIAQDDTQSVGYEIEYNRGLGFHGDSPLMALNHPPALKRVGRPNGG